MVTDDDLVILASEAGVLPMPDSKIVRKWRLQPGKMLLIDLEQGRMIEDDELKANIVNTKPYKQWIENLRIKLDQVEVPARLRGPRRLPSCPCWSASRPSASPRKTSSSCWHPWPRMARKAWAPWATTARWPCCRTRTSRCTTTSARCSRR